MNKNNLIEIRKRLLAVVFAGVVLGTSGCSNNKSENIVPKCIIVPSEFSNIDDYYKYVINDKVATKLYKSENVYLLFDKDTYNVKEYIFDTVLGKYGGQLYDLESEKQLFYSNDIDIVYNYEYYNYLNDVNYTVCLKDACDYISGHVNKDYYSLNEIKDLEPQIVESIRIINAAKVKTK